MSHPLVGRLVARQKSEIRYRVLDVVAQTYLRESDDEEPRIVWWLLAMGPDNELYTLDAHEVRVEKENYEW